MELTTLYAGQLAPGCIVSVVRVRKFILSPSYRKVVPGIPERYRYTYDLLVFDGAVRGNVSLTPELGTLVNLGLIRVGSRLQLTHATARRDVSYAAQKSDRGLVVCALRLLDAQCSSAAVDRLCRAAAEASYASLCIPSYRPLYASRSSYVGYLSEDRVHEMGTTSRIAESASKVDTRATTQYPRQLDAPNQLIIARVQLRSLHHEVVAESEEPRAPTDLGEMHTIKIAVVPEKGKEGIHLPSLEEVYQGYLPPRYPAPEYDGQGAPTGGLAKGRKRTFLETLGREKPWLVGRIAAVSRVLHYATPLRDDKWPYQFRFVLRDASRSITVTAWGVSAVKWQYAIATAGPNALIAICGLGVKQQENGELSFNLNNNANEIEEVYLLDDTQLIRGEELQLLRSQVPDGSKGLPLGELFPTIDLNMRTSAQVVAKALVGESLAIAGFIVRVGPVCRSTVYDADVLVAAARLEGSGAGAPVYESALKPYNTGITHANAHGPAASPVPAVQLKRRLAAALQLGPPAGSDIMYAYRWVWIRDAHSPHDIAIKLYSNSGDEFLHDDASLSPGRLAFFVSLRLVGGPVGSPARPVYLVSTDVTQTYTSTTVPVPKGKGEMMPDAGVLTQMAYRRPARERWALSARMYGLALVKGMADEEAAAPVPALTYYPLLHSALMAWRAMQMTGSFDGLEGCAAIPRFLDDSETSVSSLVRPHTFTQYCNLMLHNGYLETARLSTPVRSSEVAPDGWASMPLVTPAEVQLLREGQVEVTRRVTGLHERGPLGRSGRAAPVWNEAQLKAVEDTEAGRAKAAERVEEARPVEPVLADCTPVHDRQVLRVLVPARFIGLYVTGREARGGAAAPAHEEEEEEEEEAPKRAPKPAAKAAPKRIPELDQLLQAWVKPEVGGRGRRSKAAGATTRSGRRSSSVVPASTGRSSLGAARKSPGGASSAGGASAAARFSAVVRAGGDSGRTSAKPGAGESSAGGVTGIVSGIARALGTKQLAAGLAPYAERLKSMTGWNPLERTHIAGPASTLLAAGGAKAAGASAKASSSAAAPASSSAAVPPVAAKAESAKPAAAAKGKQPLRRAASAARILRRGVTELHGSPYLSRAQVLAHVGEDIDLSHPADDDGQDYSPCDVVEERWAAMKGKALERRAEWVEEQEEAGAGAGAGGMDTDEPKPPQASDVEAMHKLGAALHAAADPLQRIYRTSFKPLLVIGLAENTRSMLTKEASVGGPSSKAAPKAAKTGTLSGTPGELNVLLRPSAALPCVSKPGAAQGLIPSSVAPSASQRWLSEHWDELPILGLLASNFFAHAPTESVEAFRKYLVADERDYVFCMTIQQRQLQEEGRAGGADEGEGGGKKGAAASPLKSKGSSATVRIEAVYDLSNAEDRGAFSVASLVAGGGPKGSGGAEEGDVEEVSF